MAFRGTWIRGQDNEGVPMGKKAQITELGLLLVACNDKKSLVDYFVGEGFSLETRRICQEQGSDQQQDWKSCTKEVHGKASGDLSVCWTVFLVFP